MNVTLLESFKSKCTGCSACQEICPSQALSMKQDAEGFYYPALNSEKCVDCGKCMKVCQIVSAPTVSVAQSVHIVYAKDDTVRAGGSSGGVMVLLSQRFKEDDGIIYGAVFDSTSKSVVHSSSESVLLSQLARSKYVQSILGHTFKAIKKDLQNGNPVLFCGTPCQITGLKKYLAIEYKNLYTVDFFCHGVPSPGIFKDMLYDLELQHGQAVSDITFREKTFGWRAQHICIYFKNGKTLISKSMETPYYFFFLKNYMLRNSCYSCDLYNKHTADITLADCWSIKSDDDKGISQILINTEKGAELISTIDRSMNTISTQESIDYSKYKHQYRTDKREQFFRYYTKKGISYVFGRYYDRERLRYNVSFRIKKRILRLMGRGEGR